MRVEATAIAGDERPNIIFIFSDQQRWDTLGCYGQLLEVTPNLDWLAREGVLFENTFTCQPVCGPSRACLQTGKHATETGCYQNGIALPPEEKTLAHWLSEAGYEVGYIGKWHLGSDGGPYLDVPEFDCRMSPVPAERRGGYKDFWLASDVLEFTSHSYDGHMFDAAGNKREFAPGRYRVDAHTDWVIEYLRTRTGNKPFFLFVSYIEPHHQNDHDHFEGPRGSKERFKNFVVPGDLADTDGDWRAEYPDYLGCCHSLDENVGRIRSELERLGQWENTLLVYTSDHGCHFRTRNAEYKRSCHDSCLRIPLLIHGPGFRGGKAVSELVSLIDLPPTIVSAGGVSPPAHMRGRLLEELVEGTATDWPAEVFAQISESHCGRAIRTKKWKYSVRAPDGVGHPGFRDSELYVEDFLYDLETDPHERDNLVRDPARREVRAQLAATLKRRMAEAGEAVPEIRPAD
jgi:uncharacterized sulfatase